MRVLPIGQAELNSIEILDSMALLRTGVHRRMGVLARQWPICHCCLS